MHYSVPKLLLALAALPLALHAATLERLSMDDIISKSSDIVRGKVIGAAASFRGTPGPRGVIYTHYTIAVSERWKGASSRQMDVAVPGGAAQGYRQTFAGAPVLNTGDEFVFFLWTSRSGLTQIIGLVQGLFAVKVDASGVLTVNRAPSSELMLDGATGQPVTDAGFNLGLTALRAQVANATRAER